MRAHCGEPVTLPAGPLVNFKFRSRCQEQSCWSSYKSECLLYSRINGQPMQRIRRREIYTQTVFGTLRTRWTSLFSTFCCLILTTVSQERLAAVNGWQNKDRNKSDFGREEKRDFLPKEAIIALDFSSLSLEFVPMIQALTSIHFLRRCGIWWRAGTSPIVYSRFSLSTNIKLLARQAGKQWSRKII